MQTWTVTFAATFLSELLNLPKAVQKKVEKKINILEKDPISAQGDAKKLKGYNDHVYRVRLGDYRLFYRFDTNWIKLLSIRKRDDRTYEIQLPTTATPTPPPHWATTEPPPSPTPPKPQNPKTPLPITQTRLQQWQIPPEYWPAILTAPHEDALLELPIPDHALQRIIDNLYPRPIAEIIAQPEYILNEPEDLQRLTTGSLTSFLLKLDPEQEKLTAFGKQGPILVKGGPGTGKSTLALYRVQRLLQEGLTPILFTTYTKALVNYSEQLLKPLIGQPLKPAGIKVATVDSIAFHHYCQAHGKPQFASTDQALTLLKTALDTAPIPGKNRFDCLGRRQTLERLGLPYLLQEIETVIDGWGIPDLTAYLSHERRGRGLPLQARLREALWRIYETWQTLMTEQGWVTWPQLRRQALAAVTQLPTPPYQAVVIDEAQDLSPVSLRFLLALVPSFTGVYLTADASQSLYQRGFSWNQIHSDLKVTGRTLLLKRNYRNTEQIITACSTILAGTEAGDSDCLTPEPSVYQGAIPTIVLTDDPEAEIEAIHQFFVASARHCRLPLHGGAVLCPNSAMGKAIAQRLQQRGTTAQFVTGNDIDINATQIKILTLHSAKGLEFPFVAIAGLQEGILPHFNADLPPEEQATTLDEQLRLFYVGCSRAMRSLLLCGSHSHPSTFLNRLSHPHWQKP